MYFVGDEIMELLSQEESSNITKEVPSSSSSSDDDSTSDENDDMQQSSRDTSQLQQSQLVSVYISILNEIWPINMIK